MALKRKRDTPLRWHWFRIAKIIQGICSSFRGFCIFSVDRMALQLRSFISKCPPHWNCYIFSPGSKLYADRQSRERPIISGIRFLFLFSHSGHIKLKVWYSCTPRSNTAQDAPVLKHSLRKCLPCLIVLLLAQKPKWPPISQTACRWVAVHFVHLDHGWARSHA